MKLALATLTCLICLTLAPVKPASADHYGRYTVTAVYGVRMRARPTTASRTIRIVPKGARVTVLTHSGNWLKFTYGGNTGWTRMEFLTKGYIAPPPPASASAGLPLCFDNTWGYVVCAPRWIADNIASAANYYGVNYWLLMRLAACESDYVTDLVSWAGAVGVFQFLPSTFYSYGSGDVWSVHDQSMVAASMISRGLGYHWDCWGR